MAIVERHVSPDQSMVLTVDLTDGDWTIGFEKYGWHTHGDILHAWGYSGSPEERVRAFVDDVLQSKRVIAIVEVDAKVTDLIIPDDYVDRPLSDNFLGKYAAPNETARFRYWNGEPWFDSTA